MCLVLIQRGLASEFGMARKGQQKLGPAPRHRDFEPTVQKELSLIDGHVDCALARLPTLPT